MNSTIKTLTLIALLSALAACGGSDDTTTSDDKAEDIADSTGSAADDIIVDTASEVVTTLADVNGFSIVADIRNPRTDYYGTEVKVTAYVKDHSNNWVDDGTVITFVADDHGAIPDQCATTEGRCTVTWVSSADRTEGYAGNSLDRSTDQLVTIMARTIGEDSFIDKDGDSKYDTNELFMSQSEPFLDANDNGTYDADTDDFDERMDFNGNGTFDETFDKFRGVSCSDSAVSEGHCASKVEVWDTLSLVASVAGKVTINFTDCSGTTLTAVTVGAATTYCITLTDSNGNTPPIGTEITAEADSVDIDIAPKSSIPDTDDYDGFDTTIRLKPRIDTTTGTLILKVTAVDDEDSYLTINVTDAS